MTCRDVLEFATIEGARACGLEDRVGSLIPGKQADVVIVRADGVAMRPLNNAVGALVYNAHVGLVDTVIVAGRTVKRHGALLDDAGARARRLAEETRDHLLAEPSGTPRSPTSRSAAHGSRRWSPLRDRRAASLGSFRRVLA